MNISGIENEKLQILRAVERFAYMRMKDICKYFYTHSDSSIRRLVNDLRDDECLRYTIDGDRNHVFAVTARGARIMRSNGLVASTTVKYLDRGNYRHRTLCNEAVLRYMEDPYCVFWTEYEIQQGKHGLLYNFRKMPDGLVLDSNYGYIWIEVERSKRSSEDWRALIRWLELVVDCEIGQLPQLTGENYLYRIEFVCDADFEQKLRKELGDDFVDSWCWFRDFEGFSH